MSDSSNDTDEMMVYIGEIRLFAGPFVPVGWAECDGATLPIKDNRALHALLKETFGGDGEKTFKLPDLRGRVPIGSGEGGGRKARAVGDAGGQDAVTLTLNEMPQHSHPFMVSNNAGTMEGPDKSKNRKMFLADMASIIGGEAVTYGVAGTLSKESPVAMAGAAMANTGLSEAHYNIMPSIGLRYIIALQGIFPARP